MIIILKKCIVIMFNEFVREDLDNEDKSRQSIEKFVFVNRKSTIQHKEVNKINSLVTRIKNKYIFQRNV